MIKSCSFRLAILSVCHILLCIFATLIPVVVPWPAPVIAQQHTVPHEWSYDGEDGPGHWGDLNPKYSACKLGQRQSPIDIPTTTEISLPPIQFNYKAVPLRIIDNGHTIMIDYAPGSSIQIGKRQYELTQIHFHHPSENTLNGKVWNMEAHLVHTASDGSLAVVAVLLQEGEANPFLHKALHHLPKKKNRADIFENVRVDATKLLPVHRGYYAFSGSLTTPPCSENVAWYVLKEPITVSAKQIEEFAQLYPHNSRPVQALHGRVIEESR